jgi:glutaredoxin-like protein NrdH
MKMNIIVYTKPKCVQCMYTKIELEKLGLRYQDIDVTQDEDAAEDAARLGHKQLPVVVVVRHGMSQRWSGFSPDRIRALILDGAA